MSAYGAIASHLFSDTKSDGQRFVHRYRPEHQQAWFTVRRGVPPLSIDGRAYRARSKRRKATA